jgi:protein involved in polysaccharide export with SLBB domain
MQSQSSAKKSASRHVLSQRVWLLICALLISTLSWAQDETTGISVPGVADLSYRLGAGDKLQIDVFNQADLTGDYTLDGNGRFTMHLIGKVSNSQLIVSRAERAG